MEPLSLHHKQTMFGMAGRVAKTTARPKATTKKFKAKAEPSVSGMMFAAEFPLKDSIKRPSERIKKTSKSKKSIETSRKNLYDNINKVGLMALVGGTLLNHSINTTNKLIAAVSGDGDKFKYYEEKNKNYMKPHFSLPSQWHQSRITFGTPWYY